MRVVLVALVVAVVSVLHSRVSLHPEVLALRHQLAVLQEVGRSPRLEPADRLLWVWLSRTWSGWHDALVLVKPSTVISEPRPVQPPEVGEAARVREAANGAGTSSRDAQLAASRSGAKPAPLDALPTTFLGGLRSETRESAALSALSRRGIVNSPG